MSVSSRLIDGCFRLFGVAKGCSSRKFYKRMRKNAIRRKGARRYCFLFCGVSVERHVYCGMPYVTFVPQSVETGKAVLYLHGSTYMNEPRAAQIRFVAEIARKTHAKVQFPIYPKLPNATILPCFALLNNFFVFLRKQGEVILVGDSSGGALALSLAATRSDVCDVVTISPWVSLSVCEEGRAVSTDVMLSIDTLDRVARLWARDLPFDDVRLSPIQGIFKGKRLFVTCGGMERFRPDVLRFCREQSERGATVRYLEGVGQQHCYPLLPTPEGREARYDIIRYLQKSLYGDRV